jgi:hypothetical protein
MKKILTILGIALSSCVYGQATLHTDSTLKTLSKAKLVEIYIQHVNSIVDKAPYAVWGLNQGIKDIDVPNIKFVTRRRQNVSICSEMYRDDISSDMSQVVYYADKQDLANAILYLQKINVELSQIK